MLFRTLPVAPCCNKVSENEKTSGNRYKADKNLTTAPYLWIWGSVRCPGVVTVLWGGPFP
jgi:hypothetical protein